MNSDNRAYAVSAADLKTLERNLNYLANNVGSVDVKVENVNEKVKKVTEEVKSINTSIKDLINEIQQTTVLTNAKQSISLAQDEINKKYGHFDNIRRKISGLFQSLEVGSIDLESIQILKQNALVDAPDYWLSSALVAICEWFKDEKEQSIDALKDAIKKDNEKTSLFFSLINLKFNRYTSSFLWLKRYLDMQDASKIENKIVPILDTLTSGNFNEEEKKYFLNKIFTWTSELSTTSNYKNTQINIWVDFLITFLDEKDYDDYYYIKYFTNKFEDINRLTNINVSQKSIYYYFVDLINEKEKISTLPKDQIDKIINLLIYNYENQELDLRKDIAKNKLIVEENGNTTKADNRFKLSEFAYLKNNDFYSVLSSIILQNDELKSNINTKKLSLALLKNIIIAAYNKLNENGSENLNINIKINNWSSSTIDGKNEKELIDSLNNHIDKESYLEINSIKLFDIKSLFTLIFGILCSIIFISVNMTPIAIIVLFAFLAFSGYCIFNNYKLRDEKIKKRNQRKLEENELLLNIIAEIVDFRFICEDGKKIKNKIINLLKSLDYNNYIKTNETRSINIEENIKKLDFNNSHNTKTDLFDDEETINNKINPPKWDLLPPYDDVRMVNRQ